MASPLPTMRPRNGPIRRWSSFLCLVSTASIILFQDASKSLTVTLGIGAFTPTCTVNHLPGFIKNLPNLREKGVDIVAVVAFNDPFVMSAFGKANHVRGNDIV